MKIFLIRHGETTGDIEDRYGGSYDDHLTELGQSQLEKTAQSLVGKGIEVIFTSPLIRAQESAAIIAEATHAPVEIRDGLQERHYGVLTGLTKAEALEKYPDVVEAHKDPRITDPGGESYEDFQTRILASFKGIAATDYKTVAIVSHGGPIKQILAFLQKSIPEKLRDGEIIEVKA